MKIKELLRDIVGLAVIFVLIITFNEFILNNSLALGIAFLFFVANYTIIWFHERKYKKNFPYKPYKSKKKTGKRILLGLWAGVHYLFFIGSYNHKKYSTQTWYPETLECYFGNISQLIILIMYLFISANLFRILGYYSLSFMAIPIATNIISIIKTRKKVK